MKLPPDFYSDDDAEENGCFFLLFVLGALFALAFLLFSCRSLPPADGPDTLQRYDPTEGYNFGMGPRPQPENDQTLRPPAQGAELSTAKGGSQQ